MRKMLFGALYVLIMLVSFSSPTMAQDRGYPISKKDGPLHKAEVVAVLKTPGACSSSAWKEIFNVTCDQLLYMFKEVDQTSNLTQVSELLGYIEGQLTESKCPVGLAQVATLRKGPNTKGVIDFNYKREFGRDELCLYNRNNSGSGKPIVPIDCWNGVKGYWTTAELAQAAQPQIVEKEVERRASTDTVRLLVGNEVSLGGFGSLKNGQVVSVKRYGYLRFVDARGPLGVTPPETTFVDRPVRGPSVPVWKSKKFWAGTALASLIAGYIGHELGQRHVECLPCKR